MEKSDLYKTAALELACFLMAKGVPFREAEETYPGHFEFCFDNPDLCEKLKFDFINGGEISALALFEKRNFLIGEIKGGGKKNGR